jgi:Tfp pilus assembly protein PilV
LDGIVDAIITIVIRMTTRLNNSRTTGREEGTTLVEVLVAAVLVAVFFASIFELNAMCLRFIDASKESLAALQSVQDRTETLRNLSFSDLTSTTVVQSLMATAANPAPFSQKATEVVKISKYPTANGVTQFTRSPDGTVVNDSVATDLGTQLVKVDVAVSWTMTLGGRARIEQTSSIISNGTKK